MKSSDVIIIGAGIIGLSLAIALRKKGFSVLIVERGKPGREASYAAAGMLAAAGDELPAALKPIALESARMFPEFVHELQDESGMKVDLRDQGTIVFSREGHFPETAEPLSPQRLKSLEPSVALAMEASNQRLGSDLRAAYLPERSVDPRALVAAALKAARHRDADISSGAEVKSLLTDAGRAVGVQTEKSRYSADFVVNCAGAWAGTIPPYEVPVKPIKGQMLAVVEAPPLQHVLRSEKVYLVPRSDGRLVIGSTLEDSGYNKQTDVSTLQGLFKAAIELVPGVGQSRRNQAWAGLRPGTPDGLPVLGETSISCYFLATGHYRDGILLAPATAVVMSELLQSKIPSMDLSSFSPARFSV